MSYYVIEVCIIRRTNPTRAEVGLPITDYSYPMIATLQG